MHLRRPALLKDAAQRRLNTRARQIVTPALVAMLLGACSHAPAPQESAAGSTCPPPAPCQACPPCAGPGPAAPAAPSTRPLRAVSWADIPGWRLDDPASAWPALRTSCSTLARQPAWQATCDAAERIGDKPTEAIVRQFFESRFTPWQLVNPDSSTEGLVTGYYEPLIQGSRQRNTRSRWPIHGVPADMLTVELGDVHPELKHLRLRGRIVGNKVVPYWSRQQIDDRGGQLPAPVLLWADDPIDLFFLQVQGSGRVRLPDGSMVRVGYADQNGHPYQSIGRWLVAQGELTLDRASMDGIKRWAQDNPQRLKELLHANPSYVFFRELPSSNEGPIGALGVPLTEGRSIAVDPRFVPLGAPVFLSTSFPNSSRPLNRLVLAQDTGGAIKGTVRADFFWGFGAEAGREAGRMRQQGQMWAILPNGMTPPALR